MTKNPTTTYDPETKIETSYVDEKLKCKLTEKELQETADSLTAAMAEREREEEELAEVKQMYKAKITAAQAKISQYFGLYESRHEMRDVRVRIEKRYDEGKVYKFRTDTGEQINVRDMLEHERQIPIPGEVEEVELEGADDEAMGEQGESEEEEMPL